MTKQDDQEPRKIALQLASCITTLENKLHHKEISQSDYDHTYKYYIEAATKSTDALIHSDRERAQLQGGAVGMQAILKILYEKGIFDTDKYEASMMIVADLYKETAIEFGLTTKEEGDKDARITNN